MEHHRTRVDFLDPRVRLGAGRAHRRSAADSVAASAVRRAPQPGATAARRHLANELPVSVAANLAVSAAPEHLRSGAAIYVYKDGIGYTLHRQGNNGFTCLVNRDGFLYGSGAFKPTCWDANGEFSYVRVTLAVGRWLSEGVPTSEIRQLIDSGFEQGEFVAPVKTGIAYMINGDLDLDVRSGRILKRVYPGHYMIYAPHISSADLGTNQSARESDPALPVVFAAGAGGERLSYIITMVGHVGEIVDHQ